MEGTDERIAKTCSLKIIEIHNHALNIYFKDFNDLHIWIWNTLGQISTNTRYGMTIHWNLQINCLKTTGLNCQTSYDQNYIKLENS